jgi:hypothetical protein
MQGSRTTGVHCIHISSTIWNTARRKHSETNPTWNSMANLAAALAILTKVYCGFTQFFQIYVQIQTVC